MSDMAKEFSFFGWIFWSLLASGLTSEAGFADTVVAVDAVFADAVVTWVAGAVVKVYLTVDACVETAVLLFKRDFLQFFRNRKKKKCSFNLHYQSKV